MTDNFMPTEGNPRQEDLSSSDTNLQTGQQGTPDTKSPEYQLQVMQQRLNDKDSFIEQLKKEAQEAREEAAKRDELMQNMEQISEVLSKQGQEQESNSSQNTDFDKDALVGEVIENLNRKQAEEKMQENYNQAIEKLKQEFGEQHVNTKVQEAAQANNLQVDDMINMAKKSPNAFYKLIGVDNKPQGSPQPMHGSVSTPMSDGQKDLAYYSKLMRENPKEYWKPETQRAFRELFIKNREN